MQRCAIVPMCLCLFAACACLPAHRLCCVCAWVCVLCSMLQCHKSQSWCNTVGSGVWALLCVQRLRKRNQRAASEDLSLFVFEPSPLSLEKNHFQKINCLWHCRKSTKCWSYFCHVRPNNHLQLMCVYSVYSSHLCVCIFYTARVNLFFLCCTFFNERVLYEAKWLYLTALCMHDG